ncbi:MAG: efflux RND transporter permease subunit [Kofleriaceae bacterium]
MSSGAHDELAQDRELVARTHNTARYFTENAQVAWVALVLTLAAGVFSYLKMPKAKDPVILVRMTVATCVWPGADAEKIEQLITRKIEQKLGESNYVEKIESISRTGVSIVYVTLRDSEDRGNKFTDLQTRLDTIRDLPAGAGPIRFQKDFGDTATLMLTLASPSVGGVELELRAAAIAREIEKVRGANRAGRATLILNFPPESEPQVLERLIAKAQQALAGVSGDARRLQGPGFLGLDIAATQSDAELQQKLRTFADENLRLSELHPDVWPLVVIHDPKDTHARLAASAADRYTNRELDQFSDLVQRYLQRLPIVARVTRAGVVPEQVYLEYAQDRIASSGVDLAKLPRLIAARNITHPGGVLEVGGKNVTIDPSGELADTEELGNVLVASSANGSPVYLRDLVHITREYVSPLRLLNTLTRREPDGRLVTHRAVTLAINMRAGSQVADFAKEVNAELAELARLLPEDLIVERTSDQPLQVKENVELFTGSLVEAIVLVVLVALIGFWEWRTALVLALSIPITLAMTFAMMHVWGIDLQQISIASLIIALGLLVDDPVVASDAIKHSIAMGWRPRIAAWLGPTKLARAILFATVTNIAAYLPFLTLTGDVGVFIYSLPIVLTMSLIASRLVSMTFIPMLGAMLLRPRKTPEPTAQERRQRGFGRVYCAIVGWAIDHRKLAFVLSVVLLLGGAASTRGLKQSFFPKDLSYLSFIDVWLPEDAPLSETRARVDEIRVELAATAEAWAKQHGRDPKKVLRSVTAFIGAGGPRFWFSVAPELPQLNYAQLLVQVEDKHDTAPLVALFQDRLSRKIAGARIDVRQLETGKPVGIPVAVRISGEHIEQLRDYASRIKAILRETPGAFNVRDDWGEDAFSVKLAVDSDRANLSGITNLDVATSAAAAMNGAVVGQLRDGDRQINIVTRLRSEERAQLSDVQDLYITSQTTAQKVPLGQVSRVDYSFQTEKIRRRNQFRTITVSCFPAPGLLPSEVLAAALPAITKVGATFAPGYRYEIAGEKEEKAKSMAQMAVVAGLLFLAIFIALVVQFRSAIKPLIVFAALPYGAVAAVASLVITRTPMGFMAILGIISLMGVIVSHIIVLFDYIEEGHERGAPMRETLIDAGLQRLRPVLVTVIATVLGLFPLAMHGGPLWEPLCYAQIGGLTFATLITLVLVPVLYTIFTRDLGLVRWEHAPARPHQEVPQDPYAYPPTPAVAQWASEPRTAEYAAWTDPYPPPGGGS